jgi:hypothetical protein
MRGVLRLVRTKIIGGIDESVVGATLKIIVVNNFDEDDNDLRDTSEISHKIRDGGVVSYNGVNLISEKELSTK